MAKKKIRVKVEHPSWCKEVNLTREDILDAVGFYTHFNIPLKPEVKALVDRVKADPFYTVTLDDQIVMARTVMADLASQTDGFRDKIFENIAVECAEQLVQANKADIDERKSLDEE